MIDFSSIKGMTIPEGSVKKIKSGASVLWEKIKRVNVLPFATDADRTTIYNGIGYKTDTRLSSTSGEESSREGMCTSGYIPATVGQVLTVEGISWISSINEYVIAYDGNNQKTGFQYADYNSQMDSRTDTSFSVKLTEEKFGTGFNAIRFCTHTIDENTVVYVE